MKKVLFTTVFVSIGFLCFGGTAGPSDDEIYLLIIPVILFILFLSAPVLVKFLKTRITEWREKRHLVNHENGIADG